MAGKKIGRKLHSLYDRTRPVFVVLIVIAAIFAGSSFAKYYSLQKQKGVAVAYDFYFSSDVLRSGITLGEEAGTIPEGLNPYVATNVWNTNGSLSTVTFSIRNYSNFLLYNDENVEIAYDVYAVVESENSNGISYYLTYGKNQEVQLSTTPVKISDQLNGGEPLTNIYSIQYRYPSGIKAYPDTVYVWVVPTSPSYIPVDEYSMGSAISISAASAEFTFKDGWGFVSLEDDTAALTDLQISTINAQAGFVYNISTTGSYAAGEDKDLVPVSLSWNSNYVELDRFSKFYNAGNIITDANGIKTLEITINTYTSNDILFYRTNRFKVADFVTQGDFKALVDATIVSAAQ